MVINKNLYKELCDYITNNINNPRINNLQVLIENYKKIRKKKNYKLKEIKINSNIVNEFFEYFFKSEKYNLDKQNLKLNECLNKVYDISDNCFVKKSKNTDEKIIINSIKNVIVLFFQDYLIKKDNKYKKIVINNQNYYRNNIYDRVLAISNKISNINLYKKNYELFKKDFMIYNFDKKYLSNSLEDDYEFLYTNLITNYIYNDSNREDKIKYMIDLINNSTFFGLNIIQITNLFNNSLYVNNTYDTNEINYFYKFGLPILMLIILGVPVTSIIGKQKKVYEKEHFIIDHKQEFTVNGKIYKQYLAEKEFYQKLKKLYIDDNFNVVKNDVTLKERAEIYNFLINLPYENFINSNIKYIEKIDETINSRENIEIVDIPFVSQKDEEVYNGCEAASLLMALKYKGELLDYTLRDFVEYMPKHESNAHEGFIYSVYDYFPNDVTHWIAPDALTKFASNYHKTVDISGSDIVILKKNILENNPVIVYVTSLFEDPIITSQEVPLNLHVVLLTGYNNKTGDYIVIDPYYGKMLINKEKFEKIYNHLKYAVVVE